MRERRAVEALSRMLANSDLEVEPVGDDEIEIRSSNVRWSFRIVWIGQGFPQDLHGVLDKLPPAGRGIVFMAERMSPGSVALLAQHRANWADRLGHVHIEGDGLLLRLDSTARSAPVTVKGEFRWSDSAGAVAEAILGHALAAPDSAAGSVQRTQALAQASGRSQAQVGKTLQLFDAEGFTAKEGAERGVSAHRRIVDASRLLSDWAGWYRRRLRRELKLSTLIRDPDQLARELVAIFGEGRVWVSGAAALNAYTPFLTGEARAQAYVEVGDEEELRYRIERHEQFRVVERGERAALAVAEPQVMATGRSLGGLRIVSPIRLYGDLLRRGGRTEEAADELREQVIGF